MDGLPETHDRVRAWAGSFDAAMRGLRAFRAAGIPVSANTHINRQNVREIPQVFERLVAEGIHAWLMQLTVAMGRAADEDSLVLEPYQVLEVLPMLARVKRRADEDEGAPGSGRATTSGRSAPTRGSFGASYPTGHMGSCGAGRTTLGIEANGDIKGCPSLPSSDYVGGNVRDALAPRHLGALVLTLRFTRQRSEKDLWGHCADCYYASHCLGGCTWTTHVLFGRPGNNPFCHHRALELLRQGRRERIVKTEAAAGMPFDHGRYEIVEEPWPPDARLSSAQLGAERRGMAAMIEDGRAP